MGRRPDAELNAGWHLNRRLAAAATMLLYAFILQFAYSDLISPVFYYLGLTYRTPSPVGTLIAILSCALVAAALPTKVEHVSEFVLWTFFLVAVAPSVLIAQYADVLDRERAITVGLQISLIFVATTFLARYAAPRFQLKFILPARLPELLAAGFTILFTGYLIVRAGASFQLASLDAVQSVRGEYKALLDGSAVLGYGVQFQTAVLNPVFMASGVVRRRKIPLLAGVVGQVLIYSVTGYKLTILSPVFVIGLAYYCTRSKRLTGMVLSLGVTLAMFTALVVDSLSGGRMLVTVFINRLIANPGVLTSAYFKVFDGQPKYLWSHSFLKSFTHSPYQLTPGYYVGKAFQGVDTQANVNLFGDGYANAGMVGVAIEVAVLLIVLALLNASAAGIPIGISAPSTLVAALGLANNSSFTSVLTGGMGGLILVFALWPRRTTAERATREQGHTPAPSLKQGAAPQTS